MVSKYLYQSQIVLICNVIKLSIFYQHGKKSEILHYKIVKISNYAIKKRKKTNKNIIKTSVVLF